MSVGMSFIVNRSPFACLVTFAILMIIAATAALFLKEELRLTNHNRALERKSKELKEEGPTESGITAGELAQTI